VDTSMLKTYKFRIFSSLKETPTIFGYTDWV
jgi:hypothetical protein